MNRPSHQQLAEPVLSKYCLNAIEQLVSLLLTDDLDREVARRPALAREFEQAVDQALEVAYGRDPSDDGAHLFLQRVLYRINRLKFFWYDDLDHYKNERS